MVYSQRSLQAQRPSRDDTSKAAARSVGYFHVQLRDSAQFKNFRNETLDKQGRIQRIAGQRSHSTAWTDQELRISKDCAHIENHRLVADTDEARRHLGRLGALEHVGGDVFRARQPEDANESQAWPGKPKSEQQKPLVERPSDKSGKEKAPQRRAQSMADKESEALAYQPGGQREQERPSPSGKGQVNPAHKQ